MGNVSEKFMEKIKTHVLCSTIFLPENRTVYEVMLKHGTARQVIGDNRIRRMRIACWITRATEIHAEQVILLSMAKMAVRSASMLRLYVTTFSFCSV
jgi:hypothetical protein